VPEAGEDGHALSPRPQADALLAEDRPLLDLVPRDDPVAVQVAESQDIPPRATAPELPAHGAAEGAALVEPVAGLPVELVEVTTGQDVVVFGVVVGVEEDARAGVDVLVGVNVGEGKLVDDPAVAVGEAVGPAALAAGRGVVGAKEDGALLLEFLGRSVGVEVVVERPPTLPVGDDVYVAEVGQLGDPAGHPAVVAAVDHVALGGLVEVGDLARAPLLPRGAAGIDDRRDEHPGQDSDDRDCDQQFDEGESVPGSLPSRSHWVGSSTTRRGPLTHLGWARRPSARSASFCGQSLSFDSCTHRW